MLIVFLSVASTVSNFGPIASVSTSELPRPDYGVSTFIFSSAVSLMPPHQS